MLRWSKINSKLKKNIVDTKIKYEFRKNVFVSNNVQRRKCERIYFLTCKLIGIYLRGKNGPTLVNEVESEGKEVEKKSET